MKCFLVVTVTCPDVPGIVERLTAAVVAQGGNWEESRLARLGGDFAGIVMVSVPSDRAEALQAALVALSSDDMTVAVKRTSPKGASASAGHVLCWIRLEGADHEGIVHDVSAYLARQGVNVESMETEVVAAPMSATPLFYMEAQLDLPPALTIDELRKNLAAIADQLGVDIQVSRDRAGR
jgi:glycine cleavage system regulatory protein